MTEPAFNARAAEQAHLLQVYAQYDIEPVSADGVYLHTRDGRKILDMYGGHAVAALGYNHPDAVAAIAIAAGAVILVESSKLIVVAKPTR